MWPVLCFFCGVLTGYAVCRLTLRHARRALATARPLALGKPIPPQGGSGTATPQRKPEPEPAILPFPRPQLRVYRGE